MVEAMLADHTQLNARLVGRLHHGPSRLDVGRDGLLYLNVLADLGAELQRLEAEVRKGTHVHEIHIGMAANGFVGLHERGAVLGGKAPSGGDAVIRANSYREADIAIGLGMLMRNGASPDHSHSHAILSRRPLYPDTMRDRHVSFFLIRFSGSATAVVHFGLQKIHPRRHSRHGK